MRYLLLSRIDLPMRMLSVLLLLTVGLRVMDFRVEEIDGVLVVIDAGLRDVRPSEPPMIVTLPELAAGCLISVPIEPPMRDLDTLVLEPDRVLELATGCLAAEEADGLYMRIILLLDVLPELEVDRLVDAETDGLLVPIELPILDLVLMVGCLVEENVDGLLIVIELPMLALLLGLIRMLEFRLTEVEPIGLRLIVMLEDDLPELVEPGRMVEIVIRLDIEPLELLLDDIVPELFGIGRITVILFELLRPGKDRLDVIVLDRLGEDLLIVILLELLRLGADRIGLGALLMDVLLELLLLEIDLLKPRLMDIDLERLGVGARRSAGARLIDGLLRVGVGALVGAGARVGAAGLAA